MRTFGWLLAAVGVLVGCSGYGPPRDLTGLTESEIVARMGPPDTERRVEGGTRLEFPRGPYGLHTWFVDLDATGRAVRAEQVLTEQNFNRINPGMGQAEVLMLLGRPGVVEQLGRSRGSIWSYRYENTFCLWFQIEITQERTVRSAGYREPPECNKKAAIP